MLASMLSVETALKRLSEADDAELGKCLSPFLHAFCEFEPGVALLTEAGRFVERQTAAGTAYDAAWQSGVRQCRKVRAPAHRLVQVHALWLREVPRQQTLADELAVVRDRLALVIERCSLTPEKRQSLNAWWTAANSIIAHATNIHADACQRMLQSHMGGVDALETHILGGFFGKLYAAEVKAAAARLTEELRLRLDGDEASDDRGNIVQNSRPQRLHAAEAGTDIDRRPRAPLNVNECDLHPVLAAAEAFLAERRKADERCKFDEGGAIHIIGIARRHLAEALSPFNQPGGLIGDDATVGAVQALRSMADNGRADSRVERIEAVIAFLGNATSQIQQAVASGPMAGEAVDDSLVTDFENHLECDRREPIITADALEAAKRWQLTVKTRRTLERLAEKKLRSDLLAAGFTDADFCDGYNHVRNVEDNDPRAPAFHNAMVEYDRRIKAIVPYLQKRFAVDTTKEVGQGQLDEEPHAQQEPPLPAAGYLGLRVDDARRTISRDGYTAVVNLQASALQWAIFKKLFANRDFPLAPEAIRAVWKTHGVEPDPSDGTVNDTVSELRAALKPLGVTIASRRRFGRLLAEIQTGGDGRGGKGKPRKR